DDRHEQVAAQWASPVVRDRLLRGAGVRRLARALLGCAHGDVASSGSTASCSSPEPDSAAWSRSLPRSTSRMLRAAVLIVSMSTMPSYAPSRSTTTAVLYRA